jgi:hypothetical protein
MSKTHTPRCWAVHTVRVTYGFLDELRDKTEEVIENVKDRFMVTIPPRALKKGP